MGLLENCLAEMAIMPSKNQLEQLQLYISEIELWNPNQGLVNATGEDVVIRHILDSLSGLKTIQGLNPLTIADIGSGAGLPGIPLAVFLPNVKFSLIECSGRRSGFLRNVVVALGLKNVQIIESQFQECHEKFDLITFRAFKPFEPELIPKLKKLLNDGGSIAAYKGKREKINSELSLIEKDFNYSSVVPLTVPYLDEERHIVLLQSIQR